MSQGKDNNDSIVQPRTLLSEEDAEKYAGQYVCVDDFGSKHVVSAAKNPAYAVRLAKQKGHTNPVVFYNPRKDEVFIFNCEPCKQETVSMNT
jgi:hypothetical protein